MEDLVAVADSFGLEIARRRPIGESFGSSVASFTATDGRHYIVKIPYGAHRAQREIAALTALADHPRVPDLLEWLPCGDDIALLIEGLPGLPWDDVGTASDEFLRDLGVAMRRMHQKRADDFDGQPTWHRLMRWNADRYLASIGEPDRTLATAARTHLERHVPLTPDTAEARLTHFDLRPGNILTDDGRFVAIIDFDACRGGHPAMDFYKLWEVVAPHVRGGLASILDGYVSEGQEEPWMDAAGLERIMTVFSAYHGLAGLAWCSARGDFTGSFPDQNRARIECALDADTRRHHSTQTHGASDPPKADR